VETTAAGQQALISMPTSESLKAFFLNDYLGIIHEN